MPQPIWWLGQREPIARFTLYVAIASFLLAILAGLQTCILSNQLAELRNENRAWIAPRIMRLNGDVKRGQEINLNLSYGNMGKEPATKVGRITETFAAIDVAFMNPKTAIQELIDEIESKTSEGSCKNKPVGRYLGTIYPGAPESYSAQIIAKSEFADKVLNGLVFIVRGCFHYETTGTEHHSGFCYFYSAIQPNKDFPGTLKFCPTGNDAT